MAAPLSLDDQLRTGGVGEDLIQLLCVTDGITLEAFPYLALSLTELDNRMSSLAEEFMRELTRKEVIVLRQIWTQTNQTQVAKAMSSNTQTPEASQTAAMSWADTFPAKLTGATLKQLRLDFESSYPSELLDSDNMPGPRLLAITQAQISKREWKWVHWKIRLSQSQHDNHQSTRLKKLAKVKSLAMQDLILDDVPQRDLPQQLGIAQLTQLLMLQAVAIALCKGAHLHVLKLYVQKFVRLATTRYEGDTSLRSPNTQEMMAADQAIWQKIADLFNLRDWTLDDAVHELTEVRGDLEALLQPRPSMRSSMPVQSVKGKGKGSKGKSKSKGKQSASSRPQWVTELQKDGQTQTLCLRYNQGSCRDPQYCLQMMRFKFQQDDSALNCAQVPPDTLNSHKTHSAGKSRLPSNGSTNMAII
eukprot:s5486_g1.t1